MQVFYTMLYGINPTKIPLKGGIVDQLGILIFLFHLYFNPISMREFINAHRYDQGVSKTLHQKPRFLAF